MSNLELVCIDPNVFDMHRTAASLELRLITVNATTMNVGYAPRPPGWPGRLRFHEHFEEMGAKYSSVDDCWKFPPGTASLLHAFLLERHLSIVSRRHNARAYPVRLQSFEWIKVNVFLETEYRISVKSCHCSPSATMAIAEGLRARRHAWFDAKTCSWLFPREEIDAVTQFLLNSDLRTCIILSRLQETPMVFQHLGVQLLHDSGSTVDGPDGHNFPFCVRSTSSHSSTSDLRDELRGCRGVFVAGVRVLVFPFFDRRESGSRAQ